MKNLISIALIITLLTITTGCSSTSSSSTGSYSTSSSSEELNLDDNITIPESYMIETSNQFDYQTGTECSAFASAYVLRHYGEEADGMELYETFPGKISEGVSPNGILTFFNELDYEAEFITDGTIDDLKKELLKGAPVIVFIHVIVPYISPHITHYIPLVGYDSEYFYFAESLEDFANCKDEKDLPYNRKTEISNFELLWENIDGMWDNPYYKISKK